MKPLYEDAQPPSPGLAGGIRNWLTGEEWLRTAGSLALFGAVAVFFGFYGHYQAADTTGAEATASVVSVLEHEHRRSRGGSDTSFHVIGEWQTESGNLLRTNFHMMSRPRDPFTVYYDPSRPQLADHRSPGQFRSLAMVGWVAGGVMLVGAIGVVIGGLRRRGEGDSSQLLIPAASEIGRQRPR